MNLIVALFLSEIKRCSCCLAVLDTPQFVSGVLLHTHLSGVLPHQSYEMPPKLDSVIKSPHYFRNVNLDQVQIKFNRVLKCDVTLPWR